MRLINYQIIILAYFSFIALTTLNDRILRPVRDINNTGSRNSQYSQRLQEAWRQHFFHSCFVFRRQVHGLHLFKEFIFSLWYRYFEFICFSTLDRINLPLFSTVLPSNSCRFCPVGLSLLIQHFKQVLWVLKFLLSPGLGNCLMEGRWKIKVNKF